MDRGENHEPKNLADGHITVEHALQLAIAHHSAGRLPQAEEIYKQILDADANQPDALHLLGVIAHQVGKYDIALELIRKALAVRPDFAEAHNNLGNSLQELDLPGEAVESYQKALAIKPDYLDAHHNLGELLIKLGELNEAVVSIQKALAIKPDFAAAHNNLGNTFRNMNRLEEAIASYHKALAVEPDFAEAQANLGMALANMGRVDEAIGSLRSALALNSELSDAHDDLGKLLLITGELDEAVQILEKSDAADSRAALLEGFYNIGSEGQFYDCLNKFIERDNNNVGVAAISAYASHQFGHPDPYPFCKNPLDFIYESKMASRIEDGRRLLNEIRMNLVESRLDYRIQPYLNFGNQSAGNIFHNPQGVLAELERNIIKEIAAYLAKYQGSDCLFIKEWPKKFKIRGWYIRMVKGGYLTSHNHPNGWLSGVLYLTLPQSDEANAGAIEFSLHGNQYKILNPNFPRKICQLTEGTMIMFPSSLFHRTIPFKSDDERFCISFDLMAL